MKNLLLVLAIWFGSSIALAHESHAAELEPSAELETSAEVEDDAPDHPTAPTLSPAPGGVAGYMDPNYIADPTAYDRFVQTAPTWLVSLVPMLIALMLLCRALSEVLHIVAAKTATKADDQVAAVISRIAKLLGNVLGHAGIGMPKAMVLAKAKKIAQKEGKDFDGEEQA